MARSPRLIGVTDSICWSRGGHKRHKTGKAGGAGYAEAPIAGTNCRR